MQYFENVEQLSPQQVRLRLSGGQANSDGTQYNARVTKQHKLLKK